MLFYQLAQLIADARLSGPDVEIHSVVYDSRAVVPGSVFVAYRGFHSDGHSYISQALARGAAAIVYENGFWSPPANVSALGVPNARLALAPLASALAGYPARSMRVVGITGTDGKTTTTYLTSVVLEAGNHSTGLMGTVDFKIGPRWLANETRQSTPEAPDVQAMLVDMVAAGCDYAVIEATSHSLSARWNRLGGCAFDIAVLTNVTQEHLDFHGSIEQYRADKSRLFAMLGDTQGSPAPGRPQADKQRKVAVVNADDPHHGLFLAAAPESATRLTYAVHNAADVRAHQVRSSRDGLQFQVTTPWGDAALQLKLTGDFNVHNALAALSVAGVEGVPLEAAVHALEQVPGVRGRMERIEQGQPFTVLVDYAHTPGSFEKLFGIVRPLTDQQLIVVFGSAGERDREKRPLQGEIAGHFCDLLILTDEDPRLEDRDAILADIAVGAERTGKRAGSGYLSIPDRSSAIRTAFAQAKAGDIVMLLGKGHEGNIIYADHKLPWNEAAEARQALRELGYTQG